MSNEQDEQAITSDATQEVTLSYPEIPELEVDSILGQGGSGTVYKGHQPFLKRDVAIKVLNVTNGSINEEFVVRFHREVQILANLIHPNIVSCFQAGMTSENSDYPVSPYLVMELVKGPSLEDWIKKKGVVDQVTALNVIEKIADALGYAFGKTIIHRDIKAENILLKPLDLHENNSGSGSEFNFIPKLADLGIARSTQVDRDDDLTVVGTMIGTPRFMAPEQFNDPENVDFKVDIYGLGCVLFHMVTGKKPFNGLNLTEMVISKNSSKIHDPQDINPNLNKKVVNLIVSMMATNKDDRPSSYENLIQQCQTIAVDLKKNTKQKTTVSKNNYKIGGIAFIFILLVSVFVYSIEAGLIFEDDKPVIEENTVLSTETPDVTNEIERPDTTPEERVAVVDNVASDVDVSSQNPSNSLDIQYADKVGVFLEPGEAYNVLISTQQDAHIYCYFENQDGEVIRFFPNRFNSNSLVLTSKPLILPGESPFNLNASKDGISERIACFSTAHDVINQLPPNVVGMDFDTLPVKSLEEVKALFLTMDKIEINDNFFDVRVF